MADIIGINTNGITEMKKAVTDFIKGVQSMNVTVSSPELHKAIKGTKTEVNWEQAKLAMNQKIVELTNQLNSFNTKLDNVKAKYAANDGTGQALTATGKMVKELKS